MGILWFSTLAAYVTLLLSSLHNCCFSLSQCIAIKTSCLSEEADSVVLKCLQALCAESISQWSRVSLLGCTSSWPCGARVGPFPWLLPPALSHSVALVCDSPWS